MKTLKFSIIVLALTLLLPSLSCKKFDALNDNPNAKEKVSSNFVLTYVLANTAKLYKSLGDVGSDISGALQYTQVGTNEGADALNHYLWTSHSWDQFYNLLRNDKIIYDASQEDKNKLFEGISLTLRAFLFATLTDLYGDVPYSESLQASSELFFPKYDKQQDIYKGVLDDLKQASVLLSDPDISQYQVDPASDILYKGDADKWRKFANSLRLRYCMSLYNKKAEMQQAGVDIVAEFNDAATYCFKSNDDDAFVSYIGTTADNSAQGGPLISPNPHYYLKPCKTIVDTLKSIDDPRLQRWVMPVQRKWDYTAASEKTITVPSIFGESYDVTVLPASEPNLDTSLYVGLPMGLATVDLVSYNDENNDSFTYPPERSPYISFLHPRYRANSETYIEMELMMYSEVEFLLSEAAQKGGFSITDAELHYKNGILASMKRWGIADGADGFDFNTYYNHPEVNYTSSSNKLERIMEQKWIAGWLSIEPWFDWRRTGFPKFKTGPVTQYGAAVPIRFMYPSPSQDPQYLVNYNEAVSGLDPTVYVPTGQSADHNYSRIWLLQGTNIPY